MRRLRAIRSRSDRLQGCVCGCFGARPRCAFVAAESLRRGGHSDTLQRSGGLYRIAAFFCWCANLRYSVALFVYDKRDRFLSSHHRCTCQHPKDPIQCFRFTGIGPEKRRHNPVRPKSQIRDHPEKKWYLSQSGCGIKSGINNHFSGTQLWQRRAKGREFITPPRRTALASTNTCPRGSAP